MTTTSLYTLHLCRVFLSPRRTRL